jgi:hypothetical protein
MFYVPRASHYLGYDVETVTAKYINYGSLSMNKQVHFGSPTLLNYTRKCVEMIYCLDLYHLTELVY